MPMIGACVITAPFIIAVASNIGKLPDGYRGRHLAWRPVAYLGTLKIVFDFKVSIIMKKTIFLGLLATLTSLCALSQSSAARPQVGKYCKLYRAGEGLVVSMLRVGPESNHETLVGFTGFDHPWEGKISKPKFSPPTGGRNLPSRIMAAPSWCWFFVTATLKPRCFYPSTAPNYPSDRWFIRSHFRPTATRIFSCRST